MFKKCIKLQNYFFLFDVWRLCAFKYIVYKPEFSAVSNTILYMYIMYYAWTKNNKQKANKMNVNTEMIHKYCISTYVYAWIKKNKQKTN